MPTFRDYRTQAGLTQSDLAKRAGIRQATLSRIESGKSNPRASTLNALADALRLDFDTLRSALAASSSASAVISPIDALATTDWPFLANLAPDLRQGLASELVASWTHSSTALEGNTISSGDTLFVLSEGLTVSGKSLREHQEIHGHAEAIGRLASLVRGHREIRASDLHQLHRAIQTGAVIDARQPIGAWKVDPNGTTAITTSGTREWHDYAHPSHVPVLIDRWLKTCTKLLRDPLLRRPAPGWGREKDPQFEARKATALDAYTDLHLGFVAIHPYADGNGRLARLLANLPVLRAGLPPILVPAEQRHAYLTLVGDWTLERGQVTSKTAPPSALKTRAPLQEFFKAQWNQGLEQIEVFQDRQQKREALQNQ